MGIALKRFDKFLNKFYKRSMRLIICAALIAMLAVLGMPTAAKAGGS